MMHETIQVRGAWEHNLKDISIDIPKNKLIAITGPSGSGKSTFAFDILQRECQRQYMESMGMVTDGMNKAKVTSIIGLSPSISISQGIHNRNPRSTVGTFTEILTYLRLHYAKCGQRVCSHCGQAVDADFVESRLEPEGMDKGEVICPHCGGKLPVLTMAHFSFNKAQGHCQTCKGIGQVNAIDPSGIVDENLSVAEGAVQMWQGVMAKHYEHVLRTLAKHYNLSFNVEKPIKDYNELERLIFFDGVDSQGFLDLYPNIKPPKKVSDGYFEGLLTFLKKKSAESIRKGATNKQIEKCFSRSICPDCHGSRLNEQARRVTIGGRSIVEVSMDTIDALSSWLTGLQNQVNDQNRELMGSIIGDIEKRASGVSKNGLGYLTLDRTLQTLSGGEVQRLRMASLLDSGLTGVLYILDEPTTGLHPKDTEKILRALRDLVNIGNTVMVIEHDMDFVRQCDYVIDFGPHAGSRGGQIVAHGKPEEIMANEESLTSLYLNRKTGWKAKDKSRSNREILIAKATANNLDQLDVSIPLHRFVTVSGVSGSGKSTLVFDVLAKAFQGERIDAEGVQGLNQIDRMILVDQKRIGRSSRSTVATYTDLFAPIRKLFASQTAAKVLGLKGSDFSFNVKGGRCEKCKGLGSIPLDMHFLDDIEVECPTCHGRRFHSKVLQVEYKGYTISEILDRTVSQNMEVFQGEKEVFRRLQVLHEVGLGYLRLGQTTSTLSGGECQRIKLSKELAKSAAGSILFLLDEPTTGLHPGDVEKLISLLNRLVEKGNSVIAIEHSLEVIAQSDWVVDLGPEGGAEGGRIIAEGPPYTVAKVRSSHTGRFLRDIL